MGFRLVPKSVTLNDLERFSRQRHAFRRCGVDGHSFFLAASLAKYSRPRNFCYSFCSHNKPPSSASLCLLPRPPRGSAFDVDSDWTRWTPYDESYFVYQQRNRLVAEGRGDTASTSEPTSTPPANSLPDLADDQCDK